MYIANINYYLRNHSKYKCKLISLMAVYIAIEWWSQVMCFMIHPKELVSKTNCSVSDETQIDFLQCSRVYGRNLLKSKILFQWSFVVIVVKTVIHLVFFCFFFLFVTDNWPNVLSVWDIATHALSRMTFIWRAENNYLNHGPGIEIHDLNSLTSHGKLSESCDELFLVSTACGPHRRSLHVWQNTEKCCDLTGSCLSFHTRW